MSLITQLIKEKTLKTPRVISAFQKIKREDFMLPENQGESEGNYPLSIGYSQTISQPFTVAFMLELLQPKRGDKVLDIGSGSGWTTALLAEIVGPTGYVFALERIPELKKFGENNVKKYNFVSSAILEGEDGHPRLPSEARQTPPKPRVQFLCSDGYEGLPTQAPFDRILVSAAASQIPQKLINQLKIGGRLVIPIGSPADEAWASSQDITVLDKISKKEYKEKTYPGFIFVPLVKD